MYRKLYAKLGIKKEDRITIYLVTNPEYAKLYAKKTKEQLFSHSKADDKKMKEQLSPDDEEFQNLGFAVLCSETFENGSWLQID